MLSNNERMQINVRFIGPNETELSHRWRRRAWQNRELFHKIKRGHYNGQRLAAAIG